MITLPLPPISWLDTVELPVSHGHHLLAPLHLLGLLPPLLLLEPQPLNHSLVHQPVALPPLHQASLLRLLYLQRVPPLHLPSLRHPLAPSIRPQEVHVVLLMDVANRLNAAVSMAVAGLEMLGVAMVASPSMALARPPLPQPLRFRLRHPPKLLVRH